MAELTKMRITIEGMFRRENGKVSFLANHPARVISLEEVNPKNPCRSQRCSQKVSEDIF